MPLTNKISSWAHMNWTLSGNWGRESLQIFCKRQGPTQANFEACRFDVIFLYPIPATTSCDEDCDEGSEVLRGAAFWSTRLLEAYLVCQHPCPLSFRNAPSSFASAPIYALRSHAHRDRLWACLGCNWRRHQRPTLICSGFILQGGPEGPQASARVFFEGSGAQKNSRQH